MIKLSDMINEGEKRAIDQAYTKFYNAYKDFANASMDIAKESTKISGDKTDQKIILKNFKKYVIPFIGLMQSWNKGKQNNPHIDESDLGLTYKKGKTVKVTHKKSGKELVIIDKPNVRKEYEKIGFYAESVNEDVYFGYYKNKKVKVNAKSDKDAKKQIISKLKIPKGDLNRASMINHTKKNPVAEKKFSFPGEVDIKKQWAVVLKGGSIGSGSKGWNIDGMPLRYSYDTEDEAKSQAKRSNKRLSPGERKYYGLRYLVRDLKKFKSRLKKN